MEDLLQDFLVEADDLLSDVDNKLVDLEKTPARRELLNDIFRGFHTIKGGAGFLNADRTGDALPPDREPVRQAAQRRDDRSPTRRWT